VNATGASPVVMLGLVPRTHGFGAKTVGPRDKREDDGGNGHDRPDGLKAYFRSRSLSAPLPRPSE
jgi:hypothetical protein